MLTVTDRQCKPVNYQVTEHKGVLVVVPGQLALLDIIDGGRGIDGC